MIGVDIIEVKRIKEFIKNKEHALRVFFEEELNYAYNSVTPEEHLAGAFCVKEAVIKALESGFINEVKVLHKSNGAPYVELFGKTKEIAGNKKINVSITHLKTIACAVCEIV